MRLGLVAGEASGDLLGAGLIHALRELHPDLRCEGVAGPAMLEAGCDAWERSEVLAVMGLVEPLKEIPRLLRLRRMLVRRWSERPPDVFVGIDAPDFNLGLELRLRRRGIRTAHYVSPSVWAWRQGRVHTIAKAVDRVLCLLPFEKAFYDRHDVPATFVGHPMADRVPAEVDTAGARGQLGLTSPTVIAVLPGSRDSEVRRLGGDFALACARLRESRQGLGFVAPMARPGLEELFAAQLDRAGVRDAFTLLDGDAPTAIAAADLVLLASGTAALQAALYQKPMVAAYRFAPLTYFLARLFRLVKVPRFTLPNLLTEEPLVPEFVQHGASPEALCRALGGLLDSPARRAEISRVFGALRGELARDANRVAAAAVSALAGGGR